MTIMAVTTDCKPYDLFVFCIHQLNHSLNQLNYKDLNVPLERQPAVD